MNKTAQALLHVHVFGYILYDAFIDTVYADTKAIIT